MLQWAGCSTHGFHDFPGWSCTANEVSKREICGFDDAKWLRIDSMGHVLGRIGLDLVMSDILIP